MSFFSERADFPASCLLSRFVESSKRVLCVAEAGQKDRWEDRERAAKKREEVSEESREKKKLKKINLTPFLKTLKNERTTKRKKERRRMR